MTNGVYRPTRESLNAHPVPDWYHDAKFGVFIHWGLFSVPGFAPNGNFADVIRNDYDRAMLVHPYAEDYWNAIKDPSTPSAQFHRRHYGGLPYSGLKEHFLTGLERWDPVAWAATFHDAGARYVVLVAKYHDGFCLWPTSVSNPYQSDWFTERDVVGELAAAVRERGMRFGIYYSGGVDWTFQRRISRTLADYQGSTPGGAYPAYADAQVRELIARYQPDILWDDISWPTGLETLFRLFADYYNAVPDGVVNDRWKHATLFSRLLRTKPVRVGFDLFLKQLVRWRPEAFDGITPPEIPHSDFRTPEYTQFTEVQAKKWEMTRGIGNSFGYNRTECDEDHADSEALLADFVDAVAKNGNLLLNVGPRGQDAQIPEEQASRLREFGAWLGSNGAAVYSTRPCSQAEAVTKDGMPVRFTQHAGAINLIILGSPEGSRLTIKDLTLTGDARLISDGSRVELTSEGDDLVLEFAVPLRGDYAPAVTVSTAT